MANSAWSGNTAGLASATSAGLVGTGAQTFAGAKTFNGGVVLPTTGGTPATLDFYETGSFTANFNGGMNTNTNNFTFTFTRIGNIVYIYVPNMLVTANATSPYWSSTGSVPTRLRPTLNSVNVPAIVCNNNTNEDGFCQISTNGNIFFYRSGEINWTSGTIKCGPYFSVFSYILS